MLTRFLATLGASLAIGCASHVPQVRVESPAARPGESHPIMFKRLVVKIARGASIGAIEGGAICRRMQDLTWKGGRVSVDAEEFGEELRDVLGAADYRVVGDPDALFDDPASWEAEFLIGGMIKQVKLIICYPLIGYNNTTDGNAEALVEVDWQIFSRRTRKVELATTTRGSTQRIDITASGPAEPLIQAFGNASRNLVADPHFAALVAPGLDEAARPTEPAIDVQLVQSAPRTDDTELMNRARMSVVTVLAGDGHGSGFIISKDGYLLTCQHVVGGAKTVNVKFVTGREVLGQVVRSRSDRDVALVKLQEDLYQPLPISTSASIQPGLDVFAIGTPLREQLGQSVTKGVVSGFRSQYDQRFIQSDVSVQPGNSVGPLLASDGNVVGIAAQGYSTEGGVTLGVNLFIPIEEALAALNIPLGR